MEPRHTTPSPSAQPADPRGLSFRAPIETLTRYAGITALVTGAMVVSGFVATGAYLSAWGIPGWVVKVDPVSAALLAADVVTLALVGAIVLFGLVELRRRLWRRGRWSTLIPLAVVLVIVGIAVVMLVTRVPGLPVVMLGAVALFAIHARGWLGDIAVAAAFALLTILSAYQTGERAGQLVRDDAAWQRPVVLSTRAPVAGLERGTAGEGSWTYEGLYLVFRDLDSVYVSVPGAGPIAWAIPASNLLSLQLGAG